MTLEKDSLGYVAATKNTNILVIYKNEDLFLACVMYPFGVGLGPRWKK